MKKLNLDLIKINKVLDWSYEKAVQGGIGVESAYELAEKYSEKHGIEKGIDKLISTQLKICGTSGFFSGLINSFDEIVKVPNTTLPNLSAVIFIQLRMIVAIAHLRGYDIKSDEVRIFAYKALSGKIPTDISDNLGVQFGKKITINLAKRLPLVGGVVKGTINVSSTKTIAEVAKNTFIALD